MTERKGIIEAVLPKELRHKTVEHFHEEYGHTGIAKSSQLVSQHYYQPKAVDDIITYVNSCETCQLVKASYQRHGLLNPIPTPEQPMELWSMDTIVMGSEARNTKAKYIQEIVDHHSRYLWAFATPTTTTQLRDMAKQSYSD